MNDECTLRALLRIKVGASGRCDEKAKLAKEVGMKFRNGIVWMVMAGVPASIGP
jgi:hypothetical protein